MYSMGRNDSTEKDERSELRATLSEMREAAFSDKLVNDLVAFYKDEWTRRGVPNMDCDYEAAVIQLPKVLSEEQYAGIVQLEQLYHIEAKLSLEISFSRGVYAAFQHCFDSGEPSTYENLVLERAVYLKNNTRFPPYEENRHKINDLIDRLVEDVDPFTKDHITGFACDWEERTFSFLRYGYRLGYYAAQSIMLEIDPSLRTKLAKHSWRTAGEINLPFSLD